MTSLLEFDNDFEATCRQFDDRRVKYLRKDKIVFVLAAATFASALSAAMLYNIIDVQQDRLLAIGIAGAATLACASFAYLELRVVKKLYLTDTQRSIVFAYKINKHLTSYVQQKSASEQKQALDLLDRLIINLADQLGVLEKKRKNELDEFEFFVNPIVKLVYVLDKASGPS